MAKGRRTKKERKQVHYPYPQYVLSLRSKTKTAHAPTPAAGSLGSYGLFAYDPGLIRADLTKTVVLSILAMATIVAIYYFKLI